jgi:thiamine biosynthesis lipoprotein
MSSQAFPEPLSFRAMGVDVLVGGATDPELREIVGLFEGWEQVFSRFRPGSELNRVNSAPAGVLTVSRLFASVLRSALAAASATGGLVDPTLGLAIEAAGYDRDFSLLAAGMDRPLGPTAPGRWSSLRLHGRLLSRPVGVQIDLNGVVKGLAADASLDLIRGDGFVVAGGDVAARGGAVVGVPCGGALSLLSGGVATSGSTRRRWRRGGAWQHHLIDPRTGRPAASRWDEVTVVAASCAAADIAAKAALLLSHRGPNWLDERGLPGRFVAGDEIVENRAWCEALFREELRAA